MRSMRYAKSADGARIAYRTTGAGEPLLLLAGQGNTHHWWDGVLDDFHAAHRTITLDYRGTGESDRPDEPYSIEGFARDALAVLDDLGVERAHVYGTSMGGRVAQWLAAHRPDRVRALVLGCTSPGGPNAVDRGDDVRRSLMRPAPEGRRALLELMYTPGWLATHPGPHHTLGDPTMTPKERLRHLVASERHDAWDALPGIQAPTLVVHGDDDLLNPTANATLLAERVPGARLCLIPGARHAYFEEFRSVAGPLVLDFLREHERA